ncbi:hypothetical protein DFP95_107147 [Cohnella lupini]|uniref:Uncharacterized protein n=1 Tax=Cohnella lupini TaxID=1294267 RepID=A0A3D9IC12_9BACL|nr:hypothetical protein DFP95_107147 [Cohnella lupini]
MLLDLQDLQDLREHSVLLDLPDQRGRLVLPELREHWGQLAQSVLLALEESSHFRRESSSVVLLWFQPLPF